MIVNTNYSIKAAQGQGHTCKTHYRNMLRHVTYVGQTVRYNQRRGGEMVASRQHEEGR